MLGGVDALYTAVARMACGTNHPGRPLNSSLSDQEGLAVLADLNGAKARPQRESPGPYFPPELTRMLHANTGQPTGPVNICAKQ